MRKRGGQARSLDEVRAKLEAMTEQRGACLVWTGHCDEYGYGRFKVAALNEDRAHRVAYRLAKGDIPPGQRVRHACDNPPCCEPDHLLVGTPADNSRDMVERGRSAKQRGEANGKAKLTEDDVREMRRAYAAGEGSQRVIGEVFGVPQITVSNVVTRRTWNHVH